jgi:predicted nucleotidyltransferase
MKLQEGYPTIQHENAARRITEFFRNQESVDAVLLFCSCARGNATADSCLDIAVLVREAMDKADQRSLESTWNKVESNVKELIELRSVGINGEFTPKDQEYGGPRTAWNWR